MNHKTELAIYAAAGLMLAGAAAIWWQGVRPSSPPAVALEPAGVLEEGVPGGRKVEQAPEPAKTIFVHIEGAVASPGVHEFPEGERLFQALEIVGLLDDADTSNLSLATVLRDTQKVYVPKVGESASIFGEGTSGGGSGSSGVTGASGGSGRLSGPAAPSADNPLNVNIATKAELEMLPGIGPVLAQAIIDWREEYGPFESVDDLLEVSGIGEKTLAKFISMIVVY